MRLIGRLEEAPVEFPFFDGHRSSGRRTFPATKHANYVRTILLEPPPRRAVYERTQTGRKKR